MWYLNLFSVYLADGKMCQCRQLMASLPGNLRHLETSDLLLKQLVPLQQTFLILCLGVKDN